MEETGEKLTKQDNYQARQIKQKLTLLKVLNMLNLLGEALAYVNFCMHACTCMCICMYVRMYIWGVTRRWAKGGAPQCFTLFLVISCTLEVIYIM